MWGCAPLQNCHWPVNDIFSVMGMGYHRKLSLTGQWQFWNSLLKMSLTGQWQFWKGWHHVGMCTFTKLSLTGQWHFLCYGNGLPQKIVIDWSMTILKPPLARIRNRLSQKIVIDRSMTILKPPLGRIRNRLSQKIVIDRSMTILK